MWILDELKKKKTCVSPAVVCRDVILNYAELWNTSEKIGAWLKAHLATKAPVVIYGNKDVEIVEIMLASLKTGRAYIPVDITFPPDRVRKIVEKTGCEVVFDLSGLSPSLDIPDIRLVDKSALCEISAHLAEEPPGEDEWVGQKDSCYILFTSGSTGEPKGVQISKENIINFVDWFARYAETQGSSVLNQVSYSFDVSVIQLYLYLPAGKALFCVDKGMLEDFGLLFRYLKTSNISSWVSTPAFIEMCAVYDAFDRALLPRLEKIILAGEPLTKKLVSVLWEKFPGIEVINGYGPTEGTVLLTCCTISREMMEDSLRELPIGRLLDGATFEIDKRVEARSSVGSAPGSAPGELVVSSKSISKGYFNNPDATAKNFSFPAGVPWPTYRTGDIVYEHDGLLYFCGRKDFQIKLNGYRIELDDISENLNRIREVASNVVLPVYRDGKVSFLAAFVCLRHDLGLSPVKTSVYLKKELARLIPSYMIPKKIVVLERFPLNTNGKIDRKQLAEKYL